MTRPPRNPQHYSDSPVWWTCPVCLKRCKSKAGGKKHIRAMHKAVSSNYVNAYLNDAPLPQTPLSERLPSPNQNASTSSDEILEYNYSFTLDDLAMHDNPIFPHSPTSSDHTLDSDASHATSNLTSQGINLKSNSRSTHHHPSLNGTSKCVELPIKLIIFFRTTV